MKNFSLAFPLFTATFLVLACPGSADGDPVTSADGGLAPGGPGGGGGP